MFWDIKTMVNWSSTTRYVGYLSFGRWTSAVKNQGMASWSTLDCSTGCRKILLNVQIVWPSKCYEPWSESAWSSTRLPQMHVKHAPIPSWTVINHYWQLQWFNCSLHSVTFPWISWLVAESIPRYDRMISVIKRDGVHMFLHLFTRINGYIICLYS